MIHSDVMMKHALHLDFGKGGLRIISAPGEQRPLRCVQRSVLA